MKKIKTEKNQQARATQEVLKIDAFFNSEDIRCLTELGFLAGGRGLVKDAEKIFDGLMQMRPERAFPYVGKAVAYLNVRQFEQAIKTLETAQQVKPEEKAEIDAFLGLSYQFAGRASESRRILESVVKSAAPSTEGTKLAIALLGLQSL